METRERLLATARDLLLEQGLAGFSMRKVAAACDLSATAIYRHFEDKDALVSAAVQEGFRIFAGYLREALDQPTPLARLRSAGQRYFDFAEDHPRYYALLFMTPSEELGLMKLHEDARREASESFQFLVDRVMDCQREGVLRAGDPRAQAACVWASLHGLASLALHGRLSVDQATLELLQEQQLDAVVSGLLTCRDQQGAGP
jgi:AcrR family transcriptional regulator